MTKILPPTFATLRNVGDPNFSAGSVWRRPQLAGHVLFVIEQWAQIEATFVRIGARCIQGETLALMTMLQAVEAQSLRRDLMLAAVRSTVRDDAVIRAFTAAYLSTNDSRENRNMFAHHLWGVADRCHDLLLYDPNQSNMDYANHVDGILKGTKKPPIPKYSAFDLNKIYVWGKKEFEIAEAEARRAATITFSLQVLIGAALDGRPTDSMLQQLHTDKQIREKYEKQYQQKPP